MRGCSLRPRRGTVRFSFGFIDAGNSHPVLGKSSIFFSNLLLYLQGINQHLPRPFANRSIKSMRASLRAVGEHIVSHGTPRAAGPFIIAVTGYLSKSYPNQVRSSNTSLAEMGMYLRVRSTCSRNYPWNMLLRNSYQPS